MRKLRFWVCLLSIYSLFIWVSALPSSWAQTTTEGNLINNIFLDTDLRQALQDIAVQAGVTIVPGPEVTGIVTAEIKNKTLEDALNIVLAGTDYDWMAKDDYYLVYSSSPDSPTFSRISQSKMFKLKHISAQQAMDLMPTAYRPYVTADLASNSLMVTAPEKLVVKVMDTLRSVDRAGLRQPSDPKSSEFARDSQVKLVRLNFVTAKVAASLIPPIFKPYVSVGEETDRLMIVAEPSMLNKIEGVVRSIDVAPRHVHLDARVVVLKHVDLLNIGLNWGWPTAHGGASVTESDWAFGMQLGLTTDGTFADDLFAAINLLEQDEKATIVASPQVVAQDGKPAEIQVATEEYFQIATSAVIQSIDLEKIATGTILKILPKIADDNTINLDLTAEVSDVVARAQDGLPVVTRRTATSSVRVKDGGTVAIAGLLDSRSRRNDQSVPGLSKLPGVGLLFQNRQDNDISEEVAIFVTARLIPDKPVKQTADKGKQSIPPVDVEQFRQQLRESYDRLHK